jgi:hypothetical protein
MITKKQEMLRYIDKKYIPKKAIRKLVIVDKNDNNHEIVLSKIELISKIIRDFDDECKGSIYENEIEVSSYEII